MSLLKVKFIIYTEHIRIQYIMLIKLLVNVILIQYINNFIKHYKTIIVDVDVFIV